jgi:rubrerythrin
MSGSLFPRFWLTQSLAWLGGRLAFASQPRTLRRLHGFARTEAQSQLELQRAAELCESSERRALYLRHALDEARHARAFAEQASRLSHALGKVETLRLDAPSEELFERWGEARFLAFVHHAERRGRLEFEVYGRLLRRLGREPLARLFEGLVRDERQHEAYSARLLEELVGKSEARRALAWAARSETWRAVRRHGRRLARVAYAAAMLIVYALLTPYALGFRWLSQPRRGLSKEA